jgi:hypothetical protein
LDVKRVFTLILVLLTWACSPKTQPVVDNKPTWLGGKPYQAGYYTGIGHSLKSGSNNYVQEAKKSALDDLVSEIKVNVSSTSILSTFESKTEAADEIEEFELVGAYEDAANYWVYYRLSKARYREIKEEQKRNAVILATDYLKKAKQADRDGLRMQALNFYFQSFRSVEKYLAEAIPVVIDGEEKLLVNEIYASIQSLLDKVQIKIEPREIQVNRRLNLSSQDVLAKVSYKDLDKPATEVPLAASFEKGSGDVFPEYKTNELGVAKILITKITSKEFEQTVAVRLNVDAISGTSTSPVYSLISKLLQTPKAQVVLKVQRPVVFLTAEEKSLGETKSTYQLSNKLKNLLANAGFEFTNDRSAADLWFDVKANAEEGSISGSIYITYLTSVIKVTAVHEAKEIYATTLDRIKGYGLDYQRSSVDAYNKALETLEKERMTELLNTILQ